MTKKLIWLQSNKQLQVIFQSFLKAIDLLEKNVAGLEEQLKEDRLAKCSQKISTTDTKDESPKAPKALEEKEKKSSPKTKVKDNKLLWAKIGKRLSPKK